jgi:[ribosomal protein S5]-alanine N-acetyltransferase
VDELFDFSEFPTLETGRLILREMTRRDADGIFAIRGDYEVTKYNSGAPYSNLDEAADLIARIAADYDHQEAVRWGVTLKGGDDQVIGMVGFNYWSRIDHRASVGYDLARDYWGRGYMPEALRAVIEFGFERMGLHRVEADCSIHNTNSMRVLEKLGFQLEGRQREQYYDDGQYHDLLLYGLLKYEYQP